MRVGSGGRGCEGRGQRRSGGWEEWECRGRGGGGWEEWECGG